MNCRLVAAVLPRIYPASCTKAQRVMYLEKEEEWLGHDLSMSNR